MAAASLAGMLALAACSDEAVPDPSSELDRATDASVADEVEATAVELAAK